MNLLDIILSIIIITLFCLGFRTIISLGQILHFIREPFEYDGKSEVMNFLKRRLQKKALKGVEGLQQIRRDYVKLSNRINWILKPFVICVICFSSAWGATIFLTLNGFYWRELIICCICSAFIIKIINDKVDW